MSDDILNEEANRLRSGENKIHPALIVLGGVILIGGFLFFALTAKKDIEVAADKEVVTIPAQVETLAERPTVDEVLIDPNATLDLIEPPEAENQTNPAIEALEGRLADMESRQTEAQKEYLAAIKSLRREIAGSTNNDRANSRAAAARREKEAADAAIQAEAKAIEEARLNSELIVMDSGDSGEGVLGRFNTTDEESNSGFLNNSFGRGVRTVSAEQLESPQYLIPQGTMIPAILETAISSDLAGTIKARVKRDIYSADSSNLLIRKGATLIGEYDSDVAIGDTRVLVAWTRLITIDHKTIAIGSPGTDARGVAGFTGDVDAHLNTKFEAAFFISVFRALADYAADEASSSNRRDTIQDGTNSSSEAVNDSLEDYLSIPPTIWIDQGENVNVFVNRDIRIQPS